MIDVTVTNVEPYSEIEYVVIVPLTLEQIIEEARHWPPEKIGELVGRLTANLHASEPQIESAWKTEIDHRVEEILSGKVQGVPGEDVSARVRKIIGR